MGSKLSWDIQREQWWQYTDKRVVHVILEQKYQKFNLTTQYPKVYVERIPIKFETWDLRLYCSEQWHFGLLECGITFVVYDRQCFS